MCVLMPPRNQQVADGGVAPQAAAMLGVEGLVVHAQAVRRVVDVRGAEIVGTDQGQGTAHLPGG